MSLANLLNQPLSLQRVTASTVDEYGNAVTGAYGAPVTVLGFLEQTASTEIQVDRDTIITEWQCFLPTGTVIGPLDRISYQGQTFEVIGSPASWWNPRTQVESHFIVALRTVVG
jgi:hypothetical protein